MRTSMIVLAAVASVSIHTSLAQADADAAREYIAEATQAIEQGDFDEATSKLELAEVELEGDNSADKAAVEKAIADTKAQITEKTAAANKPKYERKLRNAMTEAEGSIGNLVTWPSAEREFNDLLNDDEAKAALGADLDAAAKKFATFKKLHTKKAGAELNAQAQQQVEQLEAEWTEAKAVLTDEESSPNSRESAVDDIGRSIADVRERLGSLDAEDPVRIDLVTRVDKLAAEYSELALAGVVAEQLESLNRKIELYQNEWEGYEQETANPTWDEYRKVTGGDMSYFLQPKTSTFVERTDDLLNNLADDDDYVAVQSNEEVAAVVNDLKARRNGAYLKLVKGVSGVVDAAEKAPIDDVSNLERLKDDVRVTLGENSAEGNALQSRLAAKIAAYESATTGAEEAKTALIATLQTKADETWPSLSEGFETESDPDMSNPGALVGKNIRFTSDNLMGYRYKPGDFYFATTLGGVHLAARVDSQLAKQIKETEEAIGRSIGDDDSDGKWEVIAVVTDRKTQLLARRDIDATGTVDGSDVRITGEYAEPVDAVVIEIIAAKCGPFAGAKDKGVLKTDGTVGE